MTDEKDETTLTEQNEDAIPSTLPLADHDPEDEVQDFRFLLPNSGSNAAQKIPSRGIKDFEPHGTNLQQSTLDASREAMHIALSQGRVHHPTGIRAVYDPVENGAWLFNPQGQLLKGIGRERMVPGRSVPTVDARGTEREEKLRRLWLLPEEALWMLERGSLDIRFPACGEAGEKEDEGLPMSLQAAYAKFIGRDLTLDEYTVYQYLKRCGYIVLRAANNLGSVPTNSPPSKPPPSAGSPSWLWRFLFPISAATPSQARLGPLVKPGLYRSYTSIFHQLALIPFHDPRLETQTYPYGSSTCTNTTPTNTTMQQAPLPKVTFHVYKTHPQFRKSAPGPPDFYITVLSARSTVLPTLTELDALLLQTPFHAPNAGGGGGGVNKRLKRGHRDVILAVVDQGITSFIGVAEAAFGCEKMFGREGGARGGGGKRGGRWRGGRGGRGGR